MSLDAVRERLLREVRARPAPTRRALRARRAIAMTVALAPLPLVVILRGACTGDRPLALAAAMFGGAAAAALLGLAALWRGRRGGLWPARTTLRALAIGVPAALAIAQLAALIAWGGGLPTPARVEAVKCALASLMSGALAIAGWAYAFRRSDPVSPGLTGAALGALVGCAVEGAQMLQCPFAGTAHLVAGHLAPIAALTLLGALAGRRWLAVR